MSGFRNRQNAEERKYFFFEKKKQKTFVRLDEVRLSRRA